MTVCAYCKKTLKREDGDIEYFLIMTLYISEKDDREIYIFCSRDCIKDWLAGKEVE